MHRRHFLAISAAGIGGVLFCAADKCTARVPNADKALQIPKHFFSPQAVAERLRTSSEILPAVL
jgi:hypothetical protein